MAHLFSMIVSAVVLILAVVAGLTLLVFWAAWWLERAEKNEYGHRPVKRQDLSDMFRIATQAK